MRVAVCYTGCAADAGEEAQDRNMLQRFAIHTNNIEGTPQGPTSFNVGWNAQAASKVCGTTPVKCRNNCMLHAQQQQWRHSVNISCMPSVSTVACCTHPNILNAPCKSTPCYT